MVLQQAMLLCYVDVFAWFALVASAMAEVTLLLPKPLDVEAADVDMHGE